jgi:protocatechuate 3,4-dioxygenase beta subunit
MPLPDDERPASAPRELARRNADDGTTGDEPTRSAGLGRREFTLGLAGGLAAALGGCRAADAADATAAARAGAESTCTLYPQQTEGPFYLDREMVRRDIKEGRPGVPLRLALRVVSAGTCAPLAGVAVDVWHCDAAGVYSGYEGQLGDRDTRGQSFLRGSQVTDADGNVRFDTVYPGWYPGRTTHVHFKVHVTRTTEATSQLYFPEDVTAAVYRRAPYFARGPKDTSNAADLVARARMPPLAALAADGSGYVASLTIAVGARAG